MPGEVTGGAVLGNRHVADPTALIVGDERVPDAFDPPGDGIERFYYGFSVFHCLPVGMVGDGAAGTGTVVRADTVRRYAHEAGLTRFEPSRSSTTSTAST